MAAPDPRTATLWNWLEPPFNREAFARVRELVPTARIANRSGLVRRLPERPVDLGSVMVGTADGNRVAFADHLVSSYCDAICVVHDGAIVHERYLGAMTPETPHLLMSVSKSICGALLGIAIGDGRVSADDLVCEVAPEFAGTSLEGATVRHVIDMTAGTAFREDYDVYVDPDADDPLLEYERQAGYRPIGDRTPIGVLGHFRTYGTAFAHGDRFDYRSVLTNVAARICEVTSGLRFADLVSRDLWGPLGQEHEADVMLDPLGMAVVEGGISCTVRDLARFGLAYLDDGLVDGRQLIPRAWVDDTRIGGPESAVTFAAGPSGERGWSHYRNAFWVMEAPEVFSGLGIFGQYCFVHRPSKTVIARQSTYPAALPEDVTAETLAALYSVCEALAS